MDRQTDRNGRLLFSYCKGYEKSRKYKSERLPTEHKQEGKEAKGK